jgi:hypothetical protein
MSPKRTRVAIPALRALTGMAAVKKNTRMRATMRMRRKRAGIARVVVAAPHHAAVVAHPLVPVAVLAHAGRERLRT